MKERYVLIVNSKRCFLHVDDTCSAFEIILERGIIGEVYNIGTNVGEAEFTVMEIAILLIKCIKRTDNFQSYTRFIEDRPFNYSRYSYFKERSRKIECQIKCHKYRRPIPRTCKGDDISQ